MQRAKRVRSQTEEGGKKSTHPDLLEHAGPRVHIPHAEAAVAAATHNGLPVRGEGEAEHVHRDVVVVPLLGCKLDGAEGAEEGSSGEV